jgi:hypothetical protein
MCCCRRRGSAAQALHGIALSRTPRRLGQGRDRPQIPSQRLTTYLHLPPTKPGCHDLLHAHYCICNLCSILAQHVMSSLPAPPRTTHLGRGPQASFHLVSSHLLFPISSSLTIGLSSSTSLLLRDVLLPVSCQSPMAARMEALRRKSSS